MPKGSEALTQARREEIVNACAALYETMGFQEITLRAIGDKTSFTRTSIYNYFQTKEEIFLALLQREHQRWAEDLEGAAGQGRGLTAEELADLLGRTLERRVCMLKLMSMNLYDMEGNSRMENLVAFKESYGAAFSAVRRCAALVSPPLGEEEIGDFLYAFFPFLFGVYPYAFHTSKQLEAMERAQVAYESPSVYQLVRRFVLRMLGA